MIKMISNEIVITIITIVLTIISSVLGLFLSRNEKTKKYYKTYLIVENKVRELMVIAENNYKNGDKKKKYVISNITTFFKENKIEFDFDLVEEIIESIISITKQINK